jgi:hypothetical protein
MSFVDLVAGVVMMMTVLAAVGLYVTRSGRGGFTS